MKLNKAEMKMAYQIESTSQNAALNEIYMTWRYASSQDTKDTAEGLLKKLRPLSDKEFMDVIREVQTNYHLPDKARTIGELLAEARQQSGAAKPAGHDIMALEWFNPDTRHMIVFDVLSHDSPMSFKGDTGHAEIDMITSIYAHILDEDRKVNAQKFESAFYSNPDLRGVRPPEEPKEPATLDLASLVEQLQKSPELASALAALIAQQAGPADK